MTTKTARKIEFRVYSYSLQKMLSVMHILHTDRTEPEIWSGDFEGGLRLTAGDFELMQFTGLHDQNDQEIYEGDILEDEDEGDIWSVDYDAEEGAFLGTSHNGGLEETIEMRDLAASTSVIGNIYENPELLEADNDD